MTFLNKKIKKIKIKTYSNKSGKLLPLSFNKKLPINVKRVFFIYGKKNKVRGNHAHKKCSQLFIPLLGKFILRINTPNKKKELILNTNSKTAILVPPKYWCSVKFFKNDSLLMVACDKYYDLKDYINNFEKYKKIFKKK